MNVVQSHTPRLISPPERTSSSGRCCTHSAIPTRLRIVTALDARPGACATGSFDVPVSKSTCTHHFRVLREAGVISQRSEGDLAAEHAAPRGP